MEMQIEFVELASEGCPSTWPWNGSKLQRDRVGCVCVVEMGIFLRIQQHMSFRTIKDNKSLSKLNN